MGVKDADFSGWATKAGLKCADGRTIMPEAFAHMDGKQIPLVWQHGHDNPENVLGHALLEARPEGLYAYGFFNGTEPGTQAKALVQHGDVNSLSIWANELIERNKQVFHGALRELSLVLAGANPGAVIENVAIAHSNGGTDVLADEAVIYTGIDIDAKEDAAVSHSATTDEEIAPTTSTEEAEVVSHAAKADDKPAAKADAKSDSSSGSDDKTIQDVFDSMTDDQKQVVYFMVGAAIDEVQGKGGNASASVAQSATNTDGDTLEHAAGDGPTMEEVFDSFTDVQKNVAYFMVGSALEDAGVNTESLAQSAIESTNDDSNKDETAQQGTENDGASDTQKTENDGTTDGNLAHGATNTEEGTEMTHNVFENQGKATGGAPTLSHDAMQKISESATELGSLKKAFLAHAVEYGIENIDVLFPEAKAIANTPELIARRQEWVQVVLNGVKKSPFARIKTVTADVTMDQARAKGYVKGNMKKDEWFRLAKRVTTPTTIYKKQKLDRDDIIDITDLDVVAFLKGEMRLMLDEEIARAILIGDGREVDDEDKVDEESIRPIAQDADFYTHKVVVATNVTGEDLVEAIVRARTNYRGSGRPTLFLTEGLLNDMMLAKDKMGRRLYNTEADLVSALRVGAIQTVDAMEDVATDEGDLLGVLVNLSDYTVGADRGGNVSMFDDFDIDYNQYKYLIETRMSGALTKFKSAQAIIRTAGTLVTLATPTFDASTGVVTIPNTTGVVWKNQDTDATLTPGAQSALAKGSSLNVVATPANGYYFRHNIDTDFKFTRPAA